MKDQQEIEDQALIVFWCISAAAALVAACWTVQTLTQTI